MPVISFPLDQGIDHYVKLNLLDGKNAVGSSLVATSPGSTDFVVTNPAATVYYLGGHASQNNTKTDTVWFEYVVPWHYTPGQNITLKVNSAYVNSGGTTITAHLTAAAYKVTDDAQQSSTLIATYAQTINGTGTDYSFTIAGTGLNPGNKLLIVLATIVNEAGNTGQVIGIINSVRLVETRRA